MLRLFKHVTLTLSEHPNVSISTRQAEIEAKQLISHAFGVPFYSAILQPDLLEQGQDQRDMLNDFVNRRCEGEPIAYISGTQPFWKHDFVVTKDVLIPRSDSECLIEAAVEWYNFKNSSVRVLEIGVGSGCLLTSILREFGKSSSGVGVDLSEGALNVAAQNAKRLSVDERMELILGDMSKESFGTPFFSNQKAFDLVVSNPPYVEKSHFVNEFEPGIAFYGHDANVQQFVHPGIPEHLRHYNFIAARLSENSLLERDGHILIEIGKDQENEIQDIFKSYDFALSGVRKDLHGIVRCLVFNHAKQE